MMQLHRNQLTTQFHDAAATAITSGFTNGAGQIWLDEVRCNGLEARLIDCSAAPLGINDCTHSEDAGARCTGTTSTCSQGAVRLQGGSDATQGRVEICNNNVWGTVCDNSWDSTDARVVCVQLGMPSLGLLQHKQQDWKCSEEVCQGSIYWGRWGRSFPPPPPPPPPQCSASPPPPPQFSVSPQNAQLLPPPPPPPQFSVSPQNAQLLPPPKELNFSMFFMLNKINMREVSVTATCV